MTKKINSFLGHKMLLIAEGNALTGCKWLLEDSNPIIATGSEEEKALINLAIIQIGEYLEGKRTDFDIQLQLKGHNYSSPSCRVGA